ncbi:MAG: gliding motility protein GldL [Cytophagales bacterium]|nr:gliding motility protein GldL [Cytophagales bacterium]
MSKNKGGFLAWFFEKVAPVATGIGAAVVILGALFKLQHYPGASEMLNIGMGTEAFLFLMLAFQPQHKEPNWAKVYPELDEGLGVATPVKRKSNQPSAAQHLDNTLEQAKIGNELIDSLGNGIKNLSQSVNKMSSLGDAFGATQAYTENVKRASNSMSEMNKSFGATLGAMNQSAQASQKVIADMASTTKNIMSQMAQTSKAATEHLASAANDAGHYHNELRNVTKNLGALNALYQAEMKDSNNHVKAMNQFYGNMSTAMSNMQAAAQQSQQFQGELNKLTSNLSSLNKVYGSMLTAMRG